MSVTAADNGSSRRIDESLFSIRQKDVRSATIERLKVTLEADRAVRGLPQQLQIGEGFSYILDHISVPVSPHDLLLGRILEEIPYETGEALLEQVETQWGRGIPPWMKDGGHECFDWSRLLTYGLSGLERHAQSELEKRAADGGKDQILDFLRGGVRIYQAFRNYALRYSDAARQAGLVVQADRCATIAERRPESFAEALQLIWLVGIVYCTMVSFNPTLTFGRIDELLQSYYLADIDAGRLTREEAGSLIEDFYCKNNLILGRGEHQMSGGSENDTGWLRNLTYDAPQYVVLGGYSAGGSTLDGDFTQLCVERIVVGFENPVVVFRYTKETPDSIWEMLSDKMRQNASILVYNDECVIPAMVRCGIEEQDAVSYTMHGCNWPDIPGKERSLSVCRFLLPEHLRSAITDGAPSESINEIYARFAASIRQVTQTCFDEFRRQRETWLSSAPGDLRVDDCFLDGPISNGRSWRLGGVKYGTVLGILQSIGSAADIVTAVEELVFVSGKVTMAELREALAGNFSGAEALRQMCLRAPKYGQDDDRADNHAKRIVETVSSIMDHESHLGTEDAVIATRCLETDTGHIRMGAGFGATPDGRHDGEPLSQNTSPYPGSCVRGLTAMLNSVSKLPLDQVNSGALNVRIQRSWVRGTDGLSRLKSLLRTYFDRGGHQIQLSVADTQELRDAQLHPESHRDLMVRITGYSAVFVDMCKQAQEEIIRRQEMGV